MRHGIFHIFILLFACNLLSQTPGTLKWKVTTGDQVFSSPAIGADGTIYTASEDNYLYALNPDGTTQWTFLTGGDIQSSPVIGPDGIIYIGSKDNKLHAVFPDGTTKWAFDAGDDVYSSAAIGDDGTIYVGCWDGRVLALSPDGWVIWEFTTEDYIRCSPAIDADGVAYIGSFDDKLYAIHPDGSLKWTFTCGDNITSSPAVGEDGTIYVGSSDGNLYAIFPGGNQKWSFPTASWILSSPAIGTDGTVYVGSNDKNLYAINSDGTLKWSYPIPGNVYSSPAVGSDGQIVFGGGIDDVNVYALNPDGTLSWSFSTGNTVRSSPAIGPDGTVYIGSDDDHLYAIYGSSQGLAKSPWPRFRRNNQNRGAFATPCIAFPYEFLFFDPDQTYQYTFSCYNHSTADMTLTQVTFSHPGFSLKNGLPVNIPLYQGIELICDVEIGTPGLHRVDYDFTYAQVGESHTGSEFHTLGYFIEDDSESAHTAHRVIEAYYACRAIDPSSASTQNNLGLLYRLLDEPDLAESSIDSALRQSLADRHGYTGVKINMGVIKSDQDSTEKADYFYTSAYFDIWFNESESSLSPLIDYNQAWEDYRSDKLSEALAHVNGTIGHAKTNDFLMAKAFVLRGAIYYTQDDRAQAVSDFEQAVGLDPDGPIGRMAQDNIDALDTGVEAIHTGLPREFILTPNFPNPFNPETTLTFGVPVHSEVQLAVYDVLGRRVRTLFGGRCRAGWHRLVWDGMDEAGRPMASGIYMIRMKAGDFRSTLKMTLIR